MATSKLQRLFGNMLDKRLPEYTIRENYKPDWLISSDKTKLELDFFIEELKIAFEVQGDQHYRYVPFFHKTEEDFKKRRKHDEEKRILCYGQRIKLIEIVSSMDAEIAINNIVERARKDNPKYLYFEQQDVTKINRDRKHLKGISKFQIRYLNQKARKEQNRNTEESKLERVLRCKKKIEMFEQGLIDADIDKVSAWRKVVEQEGYSS